MPQESKPEPSDTKPKAVSGEVIRLKTRRTSRAIRKVPGLGTVKLQPFISMRMESDARQAAAGKESPGRAYAASLLSQAVLDPPLTSDAADALPPETWQRLAAELAKEMGVTSHFDALDAELDPRDRLYRADQLRWQEFAKELSVAVGPVLETFRKNLVPTLALVRPALLNVNQSLISAGTALVSMQSMLKKLVDSGSLATMIRASQSMASRTGPAVDMALISSRINSAMIHTPTFVPVLPASRPPRLLPSPEEATRARMVDAYDVLVQLEQSMRQVVESELFAKAGANWWKQHVPEQIRTACQLNKSRAASAGDGRSLIEYAYVHDYRAIIMKKDNWSEVFQPIFGSATQTEACFEWCGAARVEIAHARPLTDQLYSDFIFGARRLISAIKTCSKGKG
jgi:hypothetical protein